MQILGPGCRDWSGFAFKRTKNLHEPGASSAVIAHAKDLDLKPPCWIGQILEPPAVGEPLIRIEKPRKHHLISDVLRSG
jgi:hypothetical protein